jgi:hypothetical protein
METVAGEGAAKLSPDDESDEAYWCGYEHGQSNRKSLLEKHQA